SAMAALHGNPNLALGNALGSNIFNTGLILSVTALITPIVVHSKIVRQELPLLILIGLLTGLLLWDGALTRWESLLLLSGFFGLIIWSIVSARTNRTDALAIETEQELIAHALPLGRAIFWVIMGLTLLLVSSRILIWGAVNIAHAIGVSDLVIGLTIVALGTSLPELAATIIATRQGEDDIAIGNIVGSNMFNLLAVIGIAGVISPIPTVSPDVLHRDWPVVMILTLALLLMTFRIKNSSRTSCRRISRMKGSLLLFIFIAYNTWLITTVLPA
ncbi:MAG: calcium/sodium antiporter, partial [Gammaproteobacteria bacterium]